MRVGCAILASRASGGFVALLLADAANLGLRSVGPYQSGNWPEMLWALGMILLLWGAMNPPLPAYALAGCAVLLLYMALRIGLVSSVSKHLGQEREESVRAKEQGLLYESNGYSLWLRSK
jgi:hypothetical protein